MTTNANTNTRVRTARTIAAIVLLPAAIGVTTWLVCRGFAAELPDPVATHWGAGSEPDGFSSRSTGILFPSLFAPGLGIVAGSALWAAFRKAPQMRRGAGGMAGFIAGLIGGIGVASLWIQRGLTDAHQARDSGVAIGVGLAVGLLAAALGAWLMPGEIPGAARASARVPREAARLPLAEGERVVWTGWARSTPLLAVAVASVALPLIVLAVLQVAIGAIIPVLLLTAAAMVSLSAFRVTVGQAGLVVRSVAGWPRFHVPLDQVAVAEPIEVSPMREFGGWGIRGDVHGRYGVVLRKGQALEVCRGDGSRFVVTVDGAAEAAALLNTLADRSRSDTHAAT